MSIYAVDVASAEWRCQLCGTVTNEAWGDWTIGDPDGTSARIAYPTACPTCGRYTYYALPNQRITLSQLAIAECFYRMKGVCNYNGSLAEADVTAALGSYAKLSDYESLPYAVYPYNGAIYYDSAIRECSAATLLSYCESGAHFYGTASEQATLIDRVCSDSNKRAVIRAIHGLSEK